MNPPSPWTRMVRCRTAVQMASDAAATGVGMWVLQGLVAERAAQGPAAWAAVCGLATALAAAYCGLYRVPMLGALGAALRRLPIAALLAALAVGTAVWVRSGAALGAAGGAALEAGAAALLGLVGSRALVGWVWCLGVWRHRVLLVGTGELTDSLRGALGRASAMGVDVVGILSRSESEAVGREGVIGRVEELDKRLRDENVDHVIVSEPLDGPPLPMDLLIAAKVHGVPISSGLIMEEQLCERLSIHQLRPEDIAFAEGFVPPRFYESVTRVRDAAMAALGLVLAAPLLLLAMAAIRLESPGSPVFQQVRMGRGGRSFRVCKLRTMREDAEEETGAVFSAGSEDDRVTRIGKFLRKTRIDELPQLWNVLVGDMAIVGPRPERPVFIEELQEVYPFFALRHSVRPGITGLAQIRFGYVSDIEGWGPKLAHDLYYVKHRSVWLDLDILLGTTRTVLLMRGV